MADEDKVKISELPAASSVNGTEVIPLVQGGVTKKAALSLLSELFGTPGAVLFTEQDLEDGEKLQALKNLGMVHEGVMVSRDPVFGHVHDKNFLRFYKKAVGTGNLGLPVYTETGADLNSSYTGKAIAPVNISGFDYYVISDFIDGARLIGTVSGWFVSGTADAPDLNWQAAGYGSYEGGDSSSTASRPLVTRVNAIIPDLTLYNSEPKHPVVLGPLSVQNNFNIGAIPFADQTIHVTPISSGVPATIASGTFHLPPASGTRHGQIVRIYCASYSVTSFTLTVDGGGTIVGVTPTSLDANTLYTFQCIERLGTGGKWIRIQESKSVINSTPTAGQTVTATSTIDSTQYLTPAGTLATMTFSLPSAANARRGQVVRLWSTQAVTTLTLNTVGGGTISGAALSAVVANTPYAWECVSTAGNGTWIRIQ